MSFFETDSLSLLEPSREMLLACTLEQMRRARGVVSLYDAETSFAACDRRAKSFDGQLPDTSHLTGVHSCGKFAAVLCRAVSAYMPGQQHGSTAARQHGSTQHGSTRAFSRFYRCFRRR